MERLTQKLIPGIIALGFGIAFIAYWRIIVNAVLNSHNKFWTEIIGLQIEVGKFGELFLRIIVLFLGLALLMAGFLLICQCFME